MKPHLFLAILFSASFLQPLISFSQTNDPAAPKKDSVRLINDEDAVFEAVDIEASYPGGVDAWRRFLEQNLNGSVAAYNSAPGGTYTVVIQFVVDKEGRLSDIKALTSHGYGMEAEVIRLLRKSPRWNPASQNGRMVKAYRKQPVTFVVIEEGRRKKKNKD